MVPDEPPQLVAGSGHGMRSAATAQFVARDAATGTYGIDEVE
jgi:hypothetical protein